MPWLETDVRKERLQFIREFESGGWSVAELCEVFHISRKTGYKLLTRYQEDGVDGLADRSRAPRSHPNQVSQAVEARIIKLRKQHPTWGSKKIRDWLIPRTAPKNVTARSTIEEILKRHGLVSVRKRRRRASPSSQPLAHAREPNDLWCADFKGWFRTGDRTRCEPLTVTDAYSRYLICCQALVRTPFETVQPCFERAFREYGLPRRIRTDNGPPFASRGLEGLTRLSVWWLKLGILPERIEPGKPQQNARHERFHRTLKEDAITPPKNTCLGQQRAFTRFRRIYNEERPHESLGGRPPAQLYRGSPRPYPRSLEDFVYPECDETRRMGMSGHYKWRGRQVFLGEAFRGETIGLYAIGDGAWSIQLGPLELAVFNERSWTVVPTELVRTKQPGASKQ